jgi:hypothetical protein
MKNQTPWCSSHSFSQCWWRSSHTSKSRSHHALYFIWSHFTIWQTDRPTCRRDWVMSESVSDAAQTCISSVGRTWAAIYNAKGTKHTACFTFSFQINKKCLQLCDEEKKYNRTLIARIRNDKEQIKSTRLDYTPRPPFVSSVPNVMVQV